MKINCMSCVNKDICKYKSEVETFQIENKTLIDTPKIDCLEICIRCKYYKDAIPTLRSIDANDLTNENEYSVRCSHCSSSSFVIPTKINLNGTISYYCTKCKSSFDE